MIQEKILTLGMIRNYILKYFPNLLWWDNFSKHEKWIIDKNYKHRQGMPNEIRIEFDSKNNELNWKNCNQTIINLISNNYSFAVYYVEGGRSPHIHIYNLDELESLSYEQRTKFRKLFLLKYCPNKSNPDMKLCDEKHLLALEFVNHFKYNKPKQLLYYFWNGMNMGIDYDLKFKVLFHTNTITKLKINFTNEIINDLKSKLYFEKIFDKYKIKYKGYMAQCPFHNDTNFSLSFSNEKFVWNCFGCNKKGDMITLIKLLMEQKENGD